MINLIDLELAEAIVSTSTEIEFTASFENFTLEGMVDLDVKIEEAIDEEVGIMSNSYYLKGLMFWYLKAKDEAGNEISLSSEDLQTCKNEIENNIENKAKEIED